MNLIYYYYYYYAQLVAVPGEFCNEPVVHAHVIPLLLSSVLSVHVPVKGATVQTVLEHSCSL